MTASLQAAVLKTPDRINRENAPGLKVGESAPDFSALNTAGSRVVLSDLYQSGPVVLIFYRGAWCPYCNLHLRQFQSKLPEFRNLGATLIAVSVDKPVYAQKISDEQNLGFDVISNPDAGILTDYKSSFLVPKELAEKYKNEYGLDLELYSGRKDYLIAVPATYVIDSGGIVRFAYADTDYTTRVSPDQVLDFLRSKK
ncbi:MAG: redoxin domain-containing protein [Candidatus Omnitrophica bacterium]|nr:redoxin domain-containing protein [Candidatus Omnitrophota bacterium]